MTKQKHRTTTKIETLSAAVDAADEHREDAIDKFEDAHFKMHRALEKWGRLDDAGKEGSPEYIKANDAVAAARDARDDALDELIGAEMDYRNAVDKYCDHRNALDKQTSQHIAPVRLQ